MKTIPVSVRLSTEDARFLAQLNVTGAVTPSDKLRAIIQEARRRHDAPRNYATCLAEVRELTDPTVAALRELEIKAALRSQLVSQVFEWLPEMTAYANSELPEKELKDGKMKAALEGYEKGIVDRVLSLVESVFRMAVTRQNPCYHEHAISDSKRLLVALELAKVVAASMTEKRSES